MTVRKFQLSLCQYMLLKVSMTFLSVLNAVGQPANQSESSAVIAVFLCVPRWNGHTGCPCSALIYHWCYANIAGHGYSAVDHTGLRHCSGRGWVFGLKGWPAPPPTHSTVVKDCWLKHEFRKATRHTRWFIRLFHWLCVCLFFLNIVFFILLAVWIYGDNDKIVTAMSWIHCYLWEHKNELMLLLPLVYYKKQSCVVLVLTSTQVCRQNIFCRHISLKSWLTSWITCTVYTCFTVEGKRTLPYMADTLL